MLPIRAESTPKAVLLYGLVLVCLILIVLLQLGILGGGSESFAILDLRIPKALIALLSGYALGVAGLLIQGLTKNPLASPSILGMTSGAALAVAAGMASPHQLWGTLTYVSAFFGALVSGALVLMISGWDSAHRDPGRLILSGAIVTALCGSLTQVIILVNEEMSDHMLYWMVGGLGQAQNSQVLPLGVVLLIGTILALLYSRRLDIITADQNVAWSLGIPVAETKITLILTSVILVAAAVAVVGPISFIGFIAPHLARLLGFRTHKHLIIITGLLGGTLLVAADYASSLITYPYQSPAGLLTGSIGALCFLAAVVTRSTKGHL